MLPINFLRHLISFYGDNLQNLVPGYLEQSMQTFARNQEQMRDYMESAFGGMSPFNSLEDIGKQNMAMFENAMKMFTPGMGPIQSKSQAQDQARGGDTSDREMNDLRAELRRMQTRLDELESGDK